MRTPQALDALREMKQVDGAVVGAGTVLHPHDLDLALDAGADFIVTPGLTEQLGRAAVAAGIPFLPGISNASGIMAGLDLGLDRVKFFPAEASGGIPTLKALAAPFGDIRFCPTGGITQQSAREWLSVDCVLCVGGSWLIDRGAPDIETISKLARAASALASAR
jgi:2-dehydro-3-deoxyphosphogluconate aldolase/(4S)-4-hydroxy-2-oxoglutarate aldolase